MSPTPESNEKMIKKNRMMINQLFSKVGADNDSSGNGKGPGRKVGLKPIKGVALPDYVKPGTGSRPTTKPIKGVPTPSYAK